MTECRKYLALAFYISNNFFTKQTVYTGYDNYTYNKLHKTDLTVFVFEKHNIICIIAYSI